jgi:hypothetical protein
VPIRKGFFTISSRLLSMDLTLAGFSLEWMCLMLLHRLVVSWGGADESLTRGPRGRQKEKRQQSDLIRSSAAPTIEERILRVPTGGKRLLGGFRLSLRGLAATFPFDEPFVKDSRPPGPNETPWVETRADQAKPRSQSHPKIQQRRPSHPNATRNMKL